MTDGLIIAAPASGSGKTVFTLGLIRHLARKGVCVGSAKVGPDYIDPAFHRAAGGRTCVNLDGWAMGDATLAAAAALAADGAELVVCEGVMGLFDGAVVAAGQDDDGSTAHIATVSGWPVVLVVDARAQAASAAAVVRGFATHRSGLGLAGVVFNRVGGDAHAAILRDAMAAALPDIPVLGCLPRLEALALPSRHLGLVQALEHPDLGAVLDDAADWVGAHVDIAALRALARPSRLAPTGAAATAPLAPPGQRIAVAVDAAFAFSYPLTLAGWHDAGAEVVPFAPLAGEGPDDAADAVYLPGGYPELYAGRLAASEGFLGGLRAAAMRGAVVYGECGGYMVLGRGLIDAEGRRHAMAGLLGLETSFAEPRLHLGYRSATMRGDGALGRAGTVLRGHEFHYAGVVGESGEHLFDTTDARGRDTGPAGLREGRVCGSFVHIIDRSAKSARP